MRGEILSSAGHFLEPAPKLRVSSIPSSIPVSVLKDLLLRPRQKLATAVMVVNNRQEEMY